MDLKFVGLSCPKGVGVGAGLNLMNRNLFGLRVFTNRFQCRLLITSTLNRVHQTEVSDMTIGGTICYSYITDEVFYEYPIFVNRIHILYGSYHEPNAIY